MKRLTENLAVKAGAVILTVLFGAICALSLIGTLLTIDQGHYSSTATDFYSTPFCSNQAYQDYLQVTDYLEYLINLQTGRAVEKAVAALESQKEAAQETASAQEEAETQPADAASDSSGEGESASGQENGKADAAAIRIPAPSEILQNAAEDSFDRLDGVEDSYLNYFQKTLASHNFKYEVKTTTGKLLFGSYAGEKYGYNASYSYRGSVSPSIYDAAGYTYSKNAGELSYNVIINYYVLDPISSGDAYYYYYQFDMFLNQNKTLMPTVCAGSVFVCMVLVIFLLCAAGHRAGREGIVPNMQDKIPFDLYLLIMLCLFLFCGTVVCSYTAEGEPIGYLFNALGLVGCGSVLLTTLLSTATRVKLGTVFQNTLLHRWGGGLLRLIRGIPLFWRGGLATVGLIFIELIFIILFHYDVNFLFIVWWLGFHGLLFFGALHVMSMLKQLQQSGEMLAAGDLEHRTDTASLRGDFKKHAENLNSVRLGITRAVEEKMKSERLKTELITNVSHDIKTPLTSIINYIDLLKKEEIGSAAADSYLEVLERQSIRLKKLIEDLVEASKASTGNINVQLARTRVGELISQSAAEYGERFAAAGLEPVVDCEEGLLVWADGRLLWRVLDNLFGNICKYALAGTRVYITARGGENNRVEIVLKNISSRPLNVQPEELMERFVRGDDSRSTEGSGLGLSIARSLTDLQRGEFSIDIDGDLFKATIRLFSAPEQETTETVDPT